MRLLIIEDNIKLATFIKSGLEQYGFRVDISDTGSNGEEKAYINSYDAILLDLNLPDKDGIEILRFLRKEKISTPVIVITARDEIEQRAFGLDLGADDYVTKPFQLLELRARIQAVIRRYHGRSNPEIVIGKLIVNPRNRSVKYGADLLVLKAKEFDILEYMAYCYPAVVSSEEIAEHIYCEDFDPFSSVLRVHIARLKKALSTAAGKDIMVTIRGKGYYLCEE